MDVISLHGRCVAEFVARVAAVPADRWDAPTPCSDWNARELVNHVVGEDRWTVPLLEGATIADVGSEFDGDLLGHDPAASTRRAADEAVAMVAEALPAGGRVHLSYGDEDMAEYIHQLAADHLIHAWDLAVATGGETFLDAELVVEVAEWFVEREALYRSAGAIGPRVEGTFEDPGAVLLAAFGRHPGWSPSS
jgi:uncharacterized protein (TIGR03086 family)